jgi:hypothetical protein
VATIPLGLVGLTLGVAIGAKTLWLVIDNIPEVWLVTKSFNAASMRIET